ncbi:MAG: response regulator [Candidatus Edwardsbacteria bacterium]|jgi:DNA-binding response OmpR family regulator|nr:response regulator [Candidatus Edwardsbacteria bacterium]
MAPDQSGRPLVMVIDDEEDILDLIQMVLEEAGIRTITALTGHEGLQRLYREKPDLILLDIMMPDLDGMELLKILKIEDSTASIPVAMLTAKVEPKDKMAAMQEEAIDYICKPFTPDELVERVRAILDRK